MSFDKRAYSRTYERETYHWRKAHHVCTKCGKEDAEPHKTLCAECAAKCAATDKKYRDSLDEERRQRIKQQKQAQKARRRNSGLCLECGKIAIKGRRFCLDCLIKTRRRNKKRYDAKRVKTIFADGLCCRCNEPALPDKMLCAKHYDIARHSMEKVNRLNQERRATANHVWRGDNKICFQQKKKRPVGGNRQGAQANNISP